MWSEGQWEDNEDISTNHQSLNELISDGGKCRTSPATPGLLNIIGGTNLVFVVQKLCVKNYL